MAKEIKLSVEARDFLERGIGQLPNTVKVTLGPKGRNMIISRSYGAPHITKNGVTVAKETELENEFENTGAQLVRKVASKTNEDAGDGTTTATVPAQSIISVGLKNIVSGANPMEVKRGIDKAIKAVVESIHKQAKEVGDDLEQITHAATISTNGDEEIGQLITQAMGEAKKEGIITVEEARGIDTTIDIVEGVQFDSGCISPHFVTDTKKTECRMEKPYILFYEKKLSAIKDLLPLLEKILQQGHSLLIIAEDIKSEALTTFAPNRLCAGLKICGVKAPGFGDRRKGILCDTTILTGGTVINKDTDLTLENATIDMPGSAKTVTIAKNKTTVVNDDDDKEAIADRANRIRHQIGNTKSDYDREKLQKRLAKLSGGAAVLYVDAGNEAEMKEKKDRVEDALSATRAAIEGGTVPGGGTAYIHAVPSVKKLEGDTGDERTDIEIIKRATREPLRQIVVNVAKEGAVVVQRVRDGKGAFGYNTRTDSFEDLMKHGVIDSAKVMRMALESAASTAGVFLTAGCIIVGIKEDKLDPAATAGTGDMGGII